MNIQIANEGYTTRRANAHAQGHSLNQHSGSSRHEPEPDQTHNQAHNQARNQPHTSARINPSAAGTGTVLPKAGSELTGDDKAKAGTMSEVTGLLEKVFVKLQEILKHFDSATKPNAKADTSQKKATQSTAAHKTGPATTAKVEPEKSEVAVSAKVAKKPAAKAKTKSAGGEMPWLSDLLKRGGEFGQNLLNTVTEAFNNAMPMLRKFLKL